MKKIPFILYGGDTCQEGAQLGIESVRRENAFVAYLTAHKPLVSYVLVGPGIRPDKPFYTPLKQAMAQSLYKTLPSSVPVIMTRKDGWGTFNETLALHDELSRRCESEVYLCSSWYHLPRIRFIWWIISRGEIKIHTISAPSPRMRSLFTECISFCKVLYSWYKWKK